MKQDCTFLGYNNNNASKHSRVTKRKKYTHQLNIRIQQYINKNFSFKYLPQKMWKHKNQQTIFHNKVTLQSWSYHLISLSSQYWTQQGNSYSNYCALRHKYIKTIKKKNFPQVNNLVVWMYQFIFYHQICYDLSLLLFALI